MNHKSVNKIRYFFNKSRGKKEKVEIKAKIEFNSSKLNLLSWENPTVTSNKLASPKKNIKDVVVFCKTS